ncbi:uncharacterized protein VDAG_03818 [Verticillium dahliae VdLs.17]|uniref:Uncharacterized protein n=1 Tax=Verticillium dahliae (strain VdLs.17 / ATCC MYA-4575 / FGSC 10137) TaxID=498257 RepID=G2X0N9_VERDV|nr:uncharacterized protein VDAG_03818 [Verticillium dahliae VdLs.17]EGY22380.1 hypothetical protein VDAG_03818 [Verticillium dahliae VdLs.17]KAF3343878.1 Cellulose synthase catalytic subunit [UDP-forming] [Verticillium dahliae VDG2]
MTNGSNAKRKKKQPARYTPEEADPVQDGDFYPLFQNQLPVPLQYPRRQHPGNAPETPALDPVAPPFSPSSATPATSSATPSSASEVGVTPDTLATPSTASRDKDGGLTTADAAAARPVIVSSSMYIDPPCFVPHLARDKARSPRRLGVGASEGASGGDFPPRSMTASPVPREGSLGHIDNDEKSEEAGEAKERHGILVAPVQRRGSSVSLSSKPVTLEGRYSAVRDMEDPFNDLFDAAAGPGSRPR